MELLVSHRQHQGLVTLTLGPPGKVVPPRPEDGQVISVGELLTLVLTRRILGIAALHAVRQDGDRLALVLWSLRFVQRQPEAFALDTLSPGQLRIWPRPRGRISGL